MVTNDTEAKITIVTFEVIGKPETRGSKKAMPVFKKGGGFLTTAKGVQISRLVDDNEKSTGWMDRVKFVGSMAYKQVGYRELLKDIPLTIVARFYFVRPKSHYGSGKNAGKLKASAPADDEHCQKPDCDKLIRAIGDGLKDAIYHDDGMANQWIAQKFWTTDNARAEIAIYCKPIQPKPARKAKKIPGPTLF